MCKFRVAGDRNTTTEEQLAKQIARPSTSRSLEALRPVPFSNARSGSRACMLFSLALLFLTMLCLGYLIAIEPLFGLRPAEV